MQCVYRHFLSFKRSVLPVLHRSSAGAEHRRGIKSGASSPPPQPGPAAEQATWQPSERCRYYSIIDTVININIQRRSPLALAHFKNLLRLRLKQPFKYIVSNLQLKLEGFSEKQRSSVPAFNKRLPQNIAYMNIAVSMQKLKNPAGAW